MNVKTITGIVLIVLGAGSLFFSHYIMTQVGEGRVKIAKGEQAVQQSDKLFSLTPGTKQVGKIATSGAQKKLKEGKQQAQDYESLANKLEIGGIVGIIAGCGVLLFGLFGKKKRR